MSNFRLLSTTENGVTVITNRFIDEYMPHANGSFVKVYLLLLRCLQNNKIETSISYLAEVLDETEKDIDRAIRYWEKEQILFVSRSDKSTITSISFGMPTAALAQSPIESEVSNINVPAIEEPVVKPVAKPTIHKPSYSDAQIKQLTDIEEVKWVMNTVERLLERLLKPADIQLVLFLYESVGFSPELIFYLYEYCISKNKKSVSYIEAVAISWAEEGITTVEKAEESTAAYNNNYNAINKAFGLNRTPGAIEKKFMHRWFHEYGFDIQIIEEACNRTMLATGKPDFKYTDKILENWKKKGVASKKDIAALDEVHAKQNAINVSNKQAATTKQPVPSTNKFNAFPQRKYSDEDFLSMEQRLLNNR
ncbi:MAG: DnaD domain protein [Clostridiales bacterium]|nr:DnaD domain protein [Clostridiales bacterium]